MKTKLPILSALPGLLLVGCDFSPKYVRPAMQIPPNYKSAAGWKPAQPGDSVLRGNWWKVFNNPELDRIEEKVCASNQTVALAAANYQAARAVVRQTQSQLFPTLGTSPAYTRARNANSVIGSTTSSQLTLPLDATWEPDFWGSIRNSVKASKLTAESAQAALENARLGVCATAAADSFQIRSLDEQEEILNSTVAAYLESLKLVQARFDTGIASDVDVAQAEEQLKTTEAQATELGIQRAQLEHALAVLTGQPAPAFALPHSPLNSKPVAVPPAIPSSLLQRRPDIASAERLVAGANAQIGMARAAFFPTVTLNGTGGYQSGFLPKLFSGPGLIWSIGASASETLFDAGKRQGVTEQAWAAYQGTVASYRQTVLSAFQDVEDNLAALRILERELQQQDAAVQSSQRHLDLATNRYKLGIDSYLNVITAQAALLSNRRTAANLRFSRMNATVLLIKALGGGWDSSRISHY